ncbi:MAG: cysteine synthase family protein [Deltaproteobacteria bacterium]|nr:cysteine synthase family protein [Deltaproteobacteria bacterium]
MKDSSIIQAIGNTPLIKLYSVTKDLPKKVEIYAKAELLNPGGSVKDRPALRMIQEGIRTGELSPGKIIMDPTSGNTGVAYAMIGSALGYRVELVVPENVSRARKEIAKSYGAKLTFSSAMEGSDGAIRLSQKLKAENPDKYFMPNQYNNHLNPQAHYESTGIEIYEQTAGRITHFITGIGTSGTVMGVGRRLKEYSSDIKVYAAEPAEALHGLEGLKHMESSIVPGIYDPSQLDGVRPIATEVGYEMTERLALEEGLFVGYSSGANVAAALELAKDLKEGVVVTILCDSGTRYLC